MAATTETQRLISVSLGKIAQSRGQRGGINLHKNLLVATVLHKARTAYMMESYSYKQKQEQLVLQSQQHQQHLAALQHASSNTANAQSTTNTTTSANGVSDKAEMCQVPRDSNLGQAAGTPAMGGESRSEICAFTGCEVAGQEPMALQENEPEIVYDKENSPPAGEDRLAAQTNVQTVDKSCSGQSQNDHLVAATQLSIDAQLASLDSSSGKQSATTCNVLKRRRDNPTASATDYECPVSKKAKVSFESSCPLSYSDFSSDISDSSSDESDNESEPEAMYTSETPQITNLVTIFNSGFSGLCPVSNQSQLTSSGCQSDLDMSSSAPQFTNLTKLRPDAPSQAFSRKMSEPSLLCSTQVGRLESLPSAIVLSA